MFGGVIYDRVLHNILDEIQSHPVCVATTAGGSPSLLCRGVSCLGRAMLLRLCVYVVCGLVAKTRVTQLAL